VYIEFCVFHRSSKSSLHKHTLDHTLFGSDLVQMPWHLRSARRHSVESAGCIEELLPSLGGIKAHYGGVEAQGPTCVYSRECRANRTTSA